jgi:hypothetical protein
LAGYDQQHFVTYLGLLDADADRLFAPCVHTSASQPVTTNAAEIAAAS